MTVPRQSILGRPSRWILETKQGFSRFRDKQHAFGLASGEVFNMDCVRITITQIDPTTFLPRNPRGKSNARARHLDTGFERTQTVNVRAMGEHSPGVPFEPVPLPEEI